MEINKQGLSAGYTNPKDVSKFKDSNNTRVKVVEGKKDQKKELPPSDLVFRVKNRYIRAQFRPSTPIKDVICNSYAKEGE